MYLLTPQRENVIDAMTGKNMPVEGVKREVLIPPDYRQEATGDIVIAPIEIKTKPKKDTE